MKPTSKVIAIAPCRPERASLPTLRRAARKAPVFLAAVAGTTAIREALEAVGLDARETGDLEALLEKERVYRDRVAHALHPRRAPESPGRAACEAFLRRDLGVAHAKLAMRLPAVSGPLFHGVEAGARGVEAIITVDLFVARCRALRDGGREEAAAHAELAGVGITGARLDELTGLAAAARAFVAVAAPGDPAPMTEEDGRARLENLRGIYRWMTIWGGVARAVVRRRDHLIRLGLATRRSRTAKAPAPPATVPLPAPTLRSVPAPSMEKSPDSRVA